MFFTHGRSTSCSYHEQLTTVYCVGCLSIVYIAIVFHYHLYNYYRVNIQCRTRLITVDHSTLNHVSSFFPPRIYNTIFLISQYYTLHTVNHHNSLRNMNSWLTFSIYKIYYHTFEHTYNIEKQYSLVL